MFISKDNFKFLKWKKQKEIGFEILSLRLAEVDQERYHSDKGDACKLGNH